MIAFHDAKIAEYLIPSLSTISMPLSELGEMATRSLVTMIRGREIPQIQRLDKPEPRVIERASIGPPSRQGGCERERSAISGDIARCFGEPNRGAKNARRVATPDRSKPLCLQVNGPMSEARHRTYWSGLLCKQGIRRSSPHNDHGKYAAKLSALHSRTEVFPQLSGYEFIKQTTGLIIRRSWVRSHPPHSSKFILDLALLITI
jgi:Periplasmic binding protein-like domain